MIPLCAMSKNLIENLNLRNTPDIFKKILDFEPNNLNCPQKKGQNEQLPSKLHKESNSNELRIPI